MKKFRMLIVAMYLVSFSAPLITMADSPVNNKQKTEKKEQVKTSFKVKNSQIQLNSQWSPEGNFLSATDANGKNLQWKDISKNVVVNGTVDTKKAGSYKVTYTYNKISQTATIDVVEPKKPVEPKKQVQPVKPQVSITGLKAKNTTIALNGAFDVSQVFDYAVKSDGTTIGWNEAANVVKVTSNVDPKKVGNYQVTFSLGNITAVSEVSVVAIPIKINLKPMAIEVGQDWDYVSHFVSVEMSDGSILNFDAVKNGLVYNQKPDNSKPGVYNVVYSYQGISAATQVTVKAKEVTPVEVKVSNGQYFVGDKWSPEMNFISVEMSDGSSLNWQQASPQLVVKGQVDTAKPGTYSVVYTFGDKSATATITVQAVEVVKVQEVSVKDMNLQIGQKWEAKDNFNYVMMSDGTKLNWKDIEEDIKVSGKVDSSKPGSYKVTYTYKDKSAEATVVVKEMEVVKVQEVSVKDTNLPIGQKWEAKDNFNHVMMSDGTKLYWKDVEKDIKVSGKVDSSKPGKYQVTYTYKDKSAVATITVREMEVVKVQEVSVKDTNLPIGQKWEAKDNFNYVKMSDGTKLYWKDVEKDIKVSGKVDSSKPGKYQVTYTYKDKSAVATITVKEMEVIKIQEVSVKDTTIDAGTKWQAKDNFNYVMRTDGIKLGWNDVQKEMKISGEVDTSRLGTYKVTYTYKDKSATATITVKAVKKTVVPVKPTTKKTLPQTGETNNIVMVVMGVLVVFGTFVFVVKQIKKEDY
ncbi:MAG: bacterial Ig-like domain-containing protein [Vagococcus sp.]|uniref:bacterial Ig-like domain-containing protein n=1 Tax=Vagococcus sp. TaxID=1933889 RepID=UPI002FCC62ED